MSMIRQTETLRSEALAKAVASTALADLIALDDAVVRMGGAAIVPAEFRVDEVASKPRSNRVRAKTDSKARSQGDIAAVALMASNKPLKLNPLFDLAIQSGAVVNGENPLNNFRSTLSRDSRFYSINKGANEFFWWLTGVPVPPEWRNEPEGSDLLAQPSGSSVSSNQEGGGGHDPATT